MSEMDDIEQKYADQLDHMSTEELAELLKTYSQSSENTDMEYMFSILEVIEKREKLNPSGMYTDIDTAWESFQNNYRPSSKESKSLYEFDEDIKDNTIYQPNIIKPKEINDVKRNANGPIRHKFLLRMACVSASLIIVILSSTIVAKAFGFDLWGAVARWTNETFGFSAQETVSPTQDDVSNPPGTEYPDLKKALTDYGVSKELAPTWIPVGFKLTGINVSETPKKMLFNAIYTKNDKSITIDIVVLSEGTNGTYEKDEQNTEVYIVNDIPHYIMNNNEQILAVWKYEVYECSISGDISKQEIEKMIDSIYER